MREPRCGSITGPYRGEAQSHTFPERAMSESHAVPACSVAAAPPLPTALPTTHWHVLDDGRIQCDVCPRACKLRDGQRGVCFVGAAGRPDRTRPPTALEWVLRRPDREEAAQPLPPGHVRAVVRYRRLQPGVPVLPELGHLEVEGDRHARRRGHARRDRAARTRARVRRAWRSPTTTRSIFLEYAVDMADACHDARRQGRRGHRGLHVRRSRGEQSTGTSMRPTSISRRSPRTSTVTCRVARPRARARHARLPPARNRRVARDHDAAHSRATTTVTTSSTR